MTRFHFMLLLLVLGPSRSVGAAAPGDADREGFLRDVTPFLTQHCVRCHGPERQEAGFTLHDLTADGGDAAKWKMAAERLLLNEMPPETEPRPAIAASLIAQSWLKHELTKAGLSLADVEARLLLPGQGNRVDHDALFSGAITGPAASPARLWRFSPQMYSALVPKITGQKPAAYGNGLQVAQPFTTSSAEGFKDFAALFTVDEPTVTQLLRNAQQIIDLQPSATKLLPPLVDSKRTATDADIKLAVKRQFEIVLFREPTESEMKRFIALMRKNIAASGLVGAKATLAAVYLLPDALYRSERGAGESDAHGRRMLAPRELAYALAFALTDQRPDATLLNAADSNKLANRDDVAREVERLLSESASKNPRIMRFFEEYFEFATAIDVFKDFDPPVLQKAWQPEVLVEDTRQLVQYVLDRDRDVLRELLTTNKSYVNYGTDPKTGKPAPAWKHPKNAKGPGKNPDFVELTHWYSLPTDWKWTAEQPIEFPAAKRTGILTQPSWLAAFATNNENHAIHRGRWIRERLLGDVVPDLPITVDAKLPDAPQQTLRERMEVTKQEYCWNCHRRMNPLGLPFESYDYLGRFRAQELDKPVVTTGNIEYRGEPALNGPVADVPELMRKLADSPRVRQVFVRHAFRYWMGRNETLVDSPTLIAADKAYDESGGSMKALITSLLTSDSFLYRFDSSHGN